MFSYDFGAKFTADTNLGPSFDFGMPAGPKLSSANGTDLWFRANHRGVLIEAAAWLDIPEGSLLLGFVAGIGTATRIGAFSKKLQVSANIWTDPAQINHKDYPSQSAPLPDNFIFGKGSKYVLFLPEDSELYLWKLDFAP